MNFSWCHAFCQKKCRYGALFNNSSVQHWSVHVYLANTKPVAETALWVFELLINHTDRVVLPTLLPIVVTA